MLPNFTKGDCILAVLDLDARTLSFGKNGDEVICAFDNIDVSSPLYPCVVFYSNTSGEKVKLFLITFPAISKTTPFRRSAISPSGHLHSEDSSVTLREASLENALPL
jgi:hypothetical protein